MTNYIFKIVVLTLVSFLIISCSSAGSSSRYSTFGVTSNGSRTIPNKMDYERFGHLSITENTDDKSYGFEESNPIKVAGLEGGGSINQARFLNGLKGPNGETVYYSRIGSCCPFDGGLLDQYLVQIEGKEDVVLFLDLYRSGELKIPAGFTYED